MGDVARLRLAAQRLVGPPCASPAEAVRHLLAVQAQDLPGALTSVALRTADRSRDAVVAALDAGVVARTWPMRGTLHLVAAEDLPWLVALAATRGAAPPGRRRELGLDDAMLGRAREVAEASLAGGKALRREALWAAWAAAGVDPSGQRGPHLLGHLAQTGTVCLGPMDGKHQLVVLLREWIPRPRTLERDEALGEVARRYFAGHGPATLQDLARWTGLTTTDARRGLELARPHLEALDVDGVEHLMDPGTPARLAAAADAPDVLLLPGFDEYVLGYGDRSAIVPARWADRLAPGGNGMFRATVVHQGQLVGTWRRERTGVAATPFGRWPRGVAAATTRAAAQLP